MRIFPKVDIDPGRRFGKPCIAGTRVDVATIVGAVTSGESVAHVASQFGISEEEVQAALRFAAQVAAHSSPTLD